MPRAADETSSRGSTPRFCVLHCRTWRWANDGDGRSRHRYGWRRRTCLGAKRTRFYMRLIQIFDDHHFDEFVETLCQQFYADEGRPGLPPGRYFRLLLIGYFEGLDAEVQAL